MQKAGENDRIKAELKFFGKTVKGLSREEFEEALYRALAGEYTREEQSKPQSVVWSIPEAEFDELYRKAQNEELKTAEAWEAELARLRKRYGIPEPRPEEAPETETEGPETEEAPPPEGPEEEEAPPRQKSEEEDIPETEQPESDRINMSPKGLVGYEFEEYLTNRFGGKGAFQKDGREFDGGIDDVWWEAKSGQYWKMLLSNPGKLAKFKSDMGHRLKIAKDYGAKYILCSNTEIPSEIKEWLRKKGIDYIEFF